MKFSPTLGGLHYGQIFMLPLGGLHVKLTALGTNSAFALGPRKTTENLNRVILDIVLFLFETQLNSVGLSVPHRKHITSPLRVRQVNAIYRYH
jgi:hypothetical protein